MSSSSLHDSFILSKRNQLIVTHSLENVRVSDGSFEFMGMSRLGRGDVDGVKIEKKLRLREVKIAATTRRRKGGMGKMMFF